MNSAAAEEDPVRTRGIPGDRLCRICLMAAIAIAFGEEAVQFIY